MHFGNRWKVKNSNSEYYPSPAGVQENHNELIQEELLLTLIRVMVDDKAFSDADIKDTQRKCIIIAECILFAKSKISFKPFRLCIHVALYLHNKPGSRSTIDTNKHSQLQ